MFVVYYRNFFVKPLNLITHYHALYNNYKHYNASIYQPKTNAKLSISTSQLNGDVHLRIAATNYWRVNFLYLSLIFFLCLLQRSIIQKRTHLKLTLRCGKPIFDVRLIPYPTLRNWGIEAKRKETMPIKSTGLSQEQKQRN